LGAWCLLCVACTSLTHSLNSIPRTNRNSILVSALCGTERPQQRTGHGPTGVSQLATSVAAPGSWKWDIYVVQEPPRKSTLTPGVLILNMQDVSSPVGSYKVATELCYNPFAYALKQSQRCLHSGHIDIESEEEQSLASKFTASCLTRVHEQVRWYPFDLHPQLH
jgi:hypothetical protein